MQQIYITTLALRATYEQYWFLNCMYRQVHVSAEKPRFSFGEVRKRLGSKLLAILKRHELLIWKDDRLMLDECAFATIDFAIDGSENPDVGMQPCEERVYCEPFFARLQERLRGTCVPQVRRRPSPHGLTIQQAWGLSS